MPPKRRRAPTLRALRKKPVPAKPPVVNADSPTDNGADASDDATSPPKEGAPPPLTKASDSEPESESDSTASRPSSRRPPCSPDPSTDSTSPKPMDSAPKDKKPLKSSAASEVGTDKERKLQKAAEEEAATAAATIRPSAKKPFQRVWTDEDEVTVLRGMLKFQAKHGGADPAANINTVYGLVRTLTHAVFTRTQIFDKVRRLKKKYETNLRRGKKGVDPSFVKVHDQTVFELSKQIWGGEKWTTAPLVDLDPDDDGFDDLGGETEKEGGKKGRQNCWRGSPMATTRRTRGRASVHEKASLVDGEGVDGKAGALYPKLREAIRLLEEEDGKNLLTESRRALDLLRPSKAKELEDRWKKHFAAGRKYLLERAELKKDLLEALVGVLDDE